MKKSFFFLPIVAALALTGCSNEDVPGQESESGGVSGDGAYLAVNIVAPTAMNGRAAGEDDFQGGKSELHENDVNSAMFLIFDASGKLMTYREENLTFTDPNPAKPVNPAVEKISNFVFILDNSQTWDDCQILALLNYRGEKFWEGTTTGEPNPDATLSNTLQKISDYSVAKFTNASGEEVNEFVMSNSVYNNALGTVTAVPIAGKVKTQKTDAEGDPVEIYVERVVAKVSTTSTATGFDVNSTTETVDGQEVTFTPEILGIEIANVATKSYLVKNIEGINFSWEWNDPLNRRSYWANIPGDMVYDNQSWDDIKRVHADEGHNFYIQENTVQDPILNKTAVLITAQLKDGTGNTPNLCYFAGNYYTLDGYLTIMANQLSKYAIKTVAEDGTVTYSSILPTHLESYQKSDWKIWQVATRLTEDAKNLSIVDANTKTAIDAAAIDEFLAKPQFQAWQWKDGMCYYYVYIEHFGTEESVGESDVPAEKLEGIVRNHVYQLTLTDLKGLGVPVFDPTRDIIPEKPKGDSFYLAARVNILKWRIVNQSIHFE